MKSKIIVSSFLLIVLFLCYYNIKIKQSPNINTVGKIDIYNNTDEDIDDLIIFCNTEIESDRYSLSVPPIKSGERIVVIFSTALSGVYDTVIYATFNNQKYTIGSLEKGYFGAKYQVELNNIKGKRFLYFMPWIPNWNMVYYYNNLGEYVEEENWSEFRNRIGYDVDKNMRLKLISVTTLQDENIYNIKKYYEQGH